MDYWGVIFYTTLIIRFLFTYYERDMIPTLPVWDPRVHWLREDAWHVSETWHHVCYAAGGRKQSHSDWNMMNVPPTNPRTQPCPASCSIPKAKWHLSFFLSTVFAHSYCICDFLCLCLSFCLPCSFPLTVSLFLVTIAVNSFFLYSLFFFCYGVHCLRVCM